MVAPVNVWSEALDWATLHAVLPALSAMHLHGLDSQASDIAQYFLLTLVQIAIIAAVLRPLENVWPAEH